MKNKLPKDPYFLGLYQGMLKFFEYHKLPIENLELFLYCSNDSVFSRPFKSKIIPINKIKEHGEENDGIQITFKSKKKPNLKTLKILRFIQHRLMYHDFPCIPKEYDTYPTEFGNESMDTCWHHSSISWIYDSTGYYFYTIQQGLCQCS